MKKITKKYIQPDLSPENRLTAKDFADSVKAEEYPVILHMVHKNHEKEGFLIMVAIDEPFECSVEYMMQTYNLPYDTEQLNEIQYHIDLYKEEYSIKIFYRDSTGLYTETTKNQILMKIADIMFKQEYEKLSSFYDVLSRLKY